MQDSVRNKPLTRRAAGYLMILAMLSMLALAPSGYAITFKFTGEITDVTDNLDIFNDGLAVGSSYEAWLTYTPPGVGVDGFYHSLPNGITYRVRLGGVQEFLADSDCGEIQIEDNGAFADRFRAFGEPFGLGALLQLELTDPTGAAFNSLALPSHLNLGDWSSTEWAVELGGQNEASVARGTITGITSSVPDTSASLPLLVLAVVPLVAVARRSVCN